jgi:large subunit ribosomal protein L15
MKLHQLSDNPGATHSRKRLGRGTGSGLGKTAGKGHKGAKARSGVAIKGFEGGQMPVYRRMPKRGFKNIFRRNFVEVTLARLQRAIDAGKLDAKKPIDGAVLREAGLFKQLHDGVRLLGGGELTAKVEITVAGATKSAIAAVEKAGGKITVDAPEAPAEEADKA